MKLPDIRGMERDKAWSTIQGVLKHEQNQLKPGHGIWYNFYNYIDLKRRYTCRPVMYKVNSLLGWCTGTALDLHHLQIKMAHNWVRRGIVAIRVTGPIVNSPQYQYGLEQKQARKIQGEKDLQAEWEANRRRERNAFRLLEPADLDI